MLYGRLVVDKAPFFWKGLRFWMLSGAGSVSAGAAMVVSVSAGEVTVNVSGRSSVSISSGAVVVAYGATELFIRRIFRFACGGFA